MDVQHEVRKWSHVIGYFDDDNTDDDGTYKSTSEAIVDTVRQYTGIEGGRGSINGVMRHAPGFPAAPDSTLCLNDLTNCYTDALQRQCDAQNASYADVRDEDIYGMVREAELRCEQIWMTIAHYLTRRKCNRTQSCM